MERQQAEPGSHPYIFLSGGSAVTRKNKKRFMVKYYQLRQRQNSFEITLFYKGMNVRVSFSGGNTYKGTFPRCITNDPFKQKAIEASQMFKDKEIVLERAVEETVVEKPAVQRQSRAKRVVPMKPVGGKPGANATGVETKAPAATGTETKAPAVDIAGVVAEEGGTKMTFDNVGEAILYVAQNYGIEVRSEKEARDAMKEHGIVPTIKRG